jgi:HAD superfamily hydrolase (TIGR01484 family)
MKVGAILSDYDGTLCPTTSIGYQYDSKIPSELEQVLWKISDLIPIVMVTSKDYAFIHHKTMFAKAASCILGIETLLLNHIQTMEKDHGDDCVMSSTLSFDIEILRRNSHLLSSIAGIISTKFKDLKVEHKFTFQGNLLAGITIDWRHLRDWGSIRKEVKSFITNLILENQNPFQLYLQPYSTHPFVDVYSAKCTKSAAFDMVSKLLDIDKNIMYLGDSENDNPAFQKADISVGVISDPRLNPKLDCDYIINFEMLPRLLRNIYNNNFNFNSDIIP